MVYHVYVIYKPWLLGLLRQYTTRDRGQRKFAVDNALDRRGSYICAKDRKAVVHIHVIYTIVLLVTWSFPALFWAS